MPEIEGYRFGRLVFDGEEETRDVIALPGRMLTDSWRADGVPAPALRMFEFALESSAFRRP